MTCAKQKVMCVIRARDGTMVIGENSCANPQPVCPRRPGEGYEKCDTICRQAGHAEQQALRNAERLRVDVRGGHAYMLGHYYACAGCCALLRDAGIASITILQGVVFEDVVLGAPGAPDPS
jgi:deoxycytidylate deaminase